MATEPKREVDPSLAIGIPITGAGVALIAAAGPFMLLMVLAGIVLMAVGIWRTRRTTPTDRDG